MIIQPNSVNLVKVLRAQSRRRSLSTSSSTLKTSMSAQACALHRCSTLRSRSKRVHQRKAVLLHSLMIWQVCQEILAMQWLPRQFSSTWWSSLCSQFAASRDLMPIASSHLKAVLPSKWKEIKLKILMSIRITHATSIPLMPPWCKEMLIFELSINSFVQIK